jgi:hypothetical protein
VVRLFLRRRAVLAAPALVLPHRRADAQMMQGIIAGKSVAPGPFWTLINQTSITNSTAGAVTTSAIDTTGANCLVAGIGYYGGAGTPTFSDSKSNSWTSPLGNTPPGLLSFLGSLPAVVGSGHTFTVTNPGVIAYATLIVYAFKSASGTPFFDYNGGNGATFTSPEVTSGTTVAVPTATPSGSNRLIWSALTDGAAGTYTVDSGLAIPIQVAYSVGVNYGFAMGWAISSAAVTVTWTLSSAAGAGGAAGETICIGSV